MPSMNSKYPYEIKSSSSFGDILTVTFWLYVDSLRGKIPFLFLFDTGADVTSLPSSAAEKLGIDLDKCPEEPMSGYEGSTILVYRSQISIIFSKKAFVIPCVFNPNEDVPILLGRAGILNRFNIILHAERKHIAFEEI